MKEIINNPNFQAVRPYEDPCEGFSSLSHGSGVDQPRSERTLTFLQRYVLKEAARKRVDVSGITGRAQIGKFTQP